MDSADNRIFDSVEDYVKTCGGTKVIKRVLVANNGIAAVKEIRSIRKWAYATFGNERAIEFVAMATPEDIAINAEYIRMADHFEAVPGGSNVNNYANVNLIVEIAERTGVQAVWAGWGHASENPKLPEKLSKTDIAFIGPPAKAMRDLGDKICSTIVAQSAEVSCVPWSGDGIIIDYQKEGGISDEIAEKANVRTVEEALEHANKIGYPLMVKASEGGGGKGIRKVLKESDLVDAFRQVQGEVPASPIFLMRLVHDAYHLEVQVLGDEYGEAISLHGRDCSIQRRHQKIIEEGPVVVADPDVWDEMEKAAVRLTKEVGYASAGTVEYLYANGEYYYLELNPRLQVEHPVTEQISDVNLPVAQLNVAMGIRLHRIPSVRQYYGEEPYGTSEINFSERKAVIKNGHVIACRITAENPEEGFKPTSGTIKELTFRSTENVWGYFSVSGMGGLHEFADSQFGHLFSHGRNRTEARQSMVLALKELSIRGEIRTPVEYLQFILETEEFKNSKIHTGWLDSLISAQSDDSMTPLTLPKPDTHVGVICGALFRAVCTFKENEEEYLESLQRGQVPIAGEYDATRMDVTLIHNDIKYNLKVLRQGPQEYRIVLGESEAEAEVHYLSDGGILIALDGKTHVCYGKQEVVGLRLTLDGKTVQFSKEYDPSSLRTTAACKLVRFLTDDGTSVCAGQGYAEVEVMKMYLVLRTREAGTVHHVANEGEVLAPGDLIATLDLADPSKVKKVTVFDGSFPELGLPRPKSAKPHHKLKALLEYLFSSLSGFALTRVGEKVAQLFGLLSDPKVPLLEIYDVIAVLPKIPDSLRESVEALLSAFEKSLEAATPELPVTDFPGGRMKAVLDEYTEELSPKDRKEQYPNYELLVQKVNEYEGGLRGRIPKIVSGLLEHYIEVESNFNGQETREQVLLRLRSENTEDLNKARLVDQAHNAVERGANEFVLLLLDSIEHSCWDQIENFVGLLHNLTELSGPSAIEVNQRARHLLIKYQLPSFGQRRAEVEEQLRRIADPKESASETEENQRVSRMTQLVKRNTALHDVLVTFFTHTSKRIREVALELYVRRTYVNYAINYVRAYHNEENDLLVAQWEFSSPAHEGLAMAPGQDTAGGVPPSGGLSRMTSIESVDDMLRLEQMARATAAARNRKGLIIVCRDISELSAKLESCLKPLLEADGEDDDDDGSGSTGDDGSTQDEVNYINVLGVCLTKPRVYSSSISTSAAASAQWRMSSRQRESFSDEVASFLQKRAALLRKAQVRRTTFLSCPKAPHAQQPELYTFREKLEYAEDPIYRHIEPSLAHHLELRRLANYAIRRVPTQDQRIHLYYAEEAGKEQQPDADRVFFVRSVVQTEQMFAEKGSSHADMLITEGLNTFSEALKALAWANRDPHFSGSANGGSNRRRTAVQNHIFFKFVSSAVLDPSQVEETIQNYSQRYGKRLWAHNLREVEILIRLKSSSSAPAIPVRFIISNPSGYAVKVHSYMEVRSSESSSSESAPGASSGGPSPATHVFSDDDEGDHDKTPGGGAGTRVIMMPLDPDRAGPRAGQDALAPYPVMDTILRKRAAAKRLNTAYVYDFPELFREASIRLWREHLVNQSEASASSSSVPEESTSSSASVVVGSPTKGFSLSAIRRGAPGSLKKRSASVDMGLIPSDVLDAVELVLSDIEGEETPVQGLREVRRVLGVNNIGMVAWRMTIKTPEYPEGRQLIVIANDITYQIGSFGLAEDDLFDRASRYARIQGYPRIYLAANSGARIGLAQEVMNVYKVLWNDEKDPTKGFRGLYVEDSDLDEIGRYVNVKELDGRKVLTDIIGKQDGIGVENLRGSGMIAGETSRAYDEIFTINLVTGRTVGIGAYLVRLGQRTVQNEGPVLLTGAPALNKVLGKEVYTSNVQLGGPQIMFTNGVSHLSVNDELMGIQAILKWISFVPAIKKGPLPAVEAHDPVDRPIGFKPDGKPYDPRHMIAGYTDTETNAWVSGFFDRNSWVETLGGWAPTVVCGRARLGGIPIAVISAESRTQNQVIPADPASDSSREEVVQRAGGVWFPDSAYKTAQAIKDFNKEDLPLMIFANWRGFSGGMRDMFDEILKFGSYIVDHLCEYEQPVFIYLPPFGELRGGAWVVLDPTINPRMMEMYADPDSRGGVLEASGTVEIKYREKLLTKTMNRLDCTLASLLGDLDKLNQEIAAAEEEEEEEEGPEGSPDALEALTTRKNRLQAQIKDRQRSLLPIYKNIAIQFAELHDTPGRMKAKNAINDIIPWDHAREFFFYRLKRRLLEERLRKDIAEVTGGSNGGGEHSDSDVTKLIQAWLGQYLSHKETGSASASKKKEKPQRKSLLGFWRKTEPPAEEHAKATREEYKACLKLGSQLDKWSDDKLLIQWLENDTEHINREVKRLKKRFIRKKVLRAASSDLSATVAAVSDLVSEMSPEQRSALLKALKSAGTK